LSEIYPTVALAESTARIVAKTSLLRLVICRQELNADTVIAFSGIDDRNLTKQALLFFFLLLRDRGIPEATCIVVNVLASVW
jgi:hypothetical protein